MPWLSTATLAALTAAYERTLTVVREENSTLRRMLEAAQARADAATAELVRSLAVTAAAPAAPLRAAPPAGRTSRDPIEGLGNILDPVPFGDPNGMFSNERAASLMFAEEEQDEHGVSAAA